MEKKNNPVKTGYSAPLSDVCYIPVENVVCTSGQTDDLTDLKEVEYGYF